MRKSRIPRMKWLIDRFLDDPFLCPAFQESGCREELVITALCEDFCNTRCRCAGWLCSACRALIGVWTPGYSSCGGIPPRHGKVEQLGAATSIDYTDEGRLIGHLSLGVSMVDERLAAMEGFPEEIALRLKHLILSHHGEYELGSPKKPAFWRPSHFTSLMISMRR